MGISYQIYDVAHQYGLNNMVESDPAILAKLTTTGVVSDSWGGGTLPVGQAGTVTLELAGGFSQVINIVYSDSENGIATSASIYKTDTHELLISETGNIPFQQSNLANALQLPFQLSGNDTITGDSFNNVLKGFIGDDKIDGGAGVDTAVFTGLSSQYTVTQTSGGMIVSGPDGTDTLVNVERLQFDNQAMAFDISGTGGEIYRLYQAAFNRAPDSSGLGYQMWAIDSAGLSLTQVAQNFINSPEFSNTYGNLDNTAFVTQLYANVLHRAPDPDGLKFHVDLLNANTISRAQDLLGFSESPENQAALIGTIGHGFSYTPHT